MHPGEDPKRHKGDKDIDPDIASLAATDGLSENDMDDRDDVASDTPTAGLEHKIDGPGPYAFLCWADGIFSMLGDADEEHTYLTLKTSALEAWGHVSHLDKEDRFDALAEHIDRVGKWHLDVTDAARDTPAAKLLQQQWEVILADEKEKEEEGDDEDEKDESEQLSGWWYEVDAQREKPAEGLPALAVELDGEGTWWVTAFRGGDKEIHEAMSDLVDYLAAGDL